MPLSTGYDLKHPDKSFILPDTLREISGLALIDTISFACVQDENGILFIYDVIENRIRKQYNFNVNGDYEEITKVGNEFYILRSDGVLFEIKNFESTTFKVHSFKTGIPATNNEGLCYDPSRNRLLVACKGKIGKGTECKDRRVIYGFDLKTKKLSKEPVFDFNIQVIRQFMDDHEITVPGRGVQKGRKFVPLLKFNISAICIHPKTKQLYVLSASDHMLFIFSMDGDIEHVEPLDPVLFNKPEGITFFENGDMLISNEGQNKKPTLLRFNYKG